MITQERAKNLEEQVQAQAELLEAQSAALKLARDSLTDWLPTDLDEQQCYEALAAIDALGDME